MQKIILAIKENRPYILIKKNKTIYSWGKEIKEIPKVFTFKSLDNYNTYASPEFEKQEDCIDFVVTKNNCKIVEISDIKELANMVIGSSFEIVDK